MIGLSQSQTPSYGGEIDTVEKLQQGFLDAKNAYNEDVWLWCYHQAKESLGISLDEITAEQAQEVTARYSDEQQKFLRLVLIDAEREYDEV